MENRDERPPYVKWERIPVEDREQSIATGMHKTKDVDFAIVTAIGSKDRIPRKVDEWFAMLDQQVREGRFKLEWLQEFKRAYEAWKKGEEFPVNGTPIKGWVVLSPAQQQNVISSNILTVEDLAQANEESCRRMGMGARDMVNKAMAWLKAANDIGKVTQENAALKTANVGLQYQVQQLSERVDELAAELKTLQPAKAA